MKHQLVKTLLSAFCAGLLFLWVGAAAQQTQVLQGHVPPAVASLKAIGPLSGGTNLYLAVALPLRNQEALTNLMSELLEPGSPSFRQWLTPEQFTAQFGPTEEDYRKVIGFATQHKLKVVATHPNRTLVDVVAPVSAIEDAFHLHLLVRR